MIWILSLAGGVIPRPFFIFKNKFVAFGNIITFGEIYGMNIGLALKEIRLKKFPKEKVKQYQIAEKIGITQTYLSQIESGQKIPAYEMVEKICKVYKIPYAVLVWHSLDEKDIQKSKLEAYRKLKPVIDSMIQNFV